MTYRLRHELQAEILSLRRQLAERTKGKPWTPQDVEAETLAGYYEPILPAMQPWQYARLNCWLKEYETWNLVRWHRRELEALDRLKAQE